MSQVLQKVVFPTSGNPDVLPLFVDADEWTDLRQTVRPNAEAVKHRRGVIPDEVHTTPLRISHVNAVTFVTGRRSIAVPDGDRVSLGTYYNAFPASYWKRWTVIDSVHLRVTTRGAGDVSVYRSNARAVVQTVETAHVDGETTTVFELPLENFLDGGWYWFDLVSRGAGFELVEADWAAPDGVLPPQSGGATVSITTLNRTAYCLALLETIGSDPDTLDVLDEVLVVDQGSDRIRDHERFAHATDALRGRLRLIEQGNVGGSGGFSRGMLETARAGRSAFVLLLDDDVEIEPESIRRAVTFGRYASEPTIVGGHMFDMYDKTKLHAFAEGVDRWNFMWGPITPDRHDFTSSNLRQTTWAHRRIDVDYNGWWMSLIPVSVVERIGLSLPVFIKWDDAEYSLRARAHGVRTVSLPGAFVWHVSWVDKDDSRDWQAFYHARNRLVAALLHSPFEKGGRLPISNFASDLRHLLTLDYSTVSLRQLAYRSVLAGPSALHDELRTRLPEVREAMKEFRESTLLKGAAISDDWPATVYFGDDPAADGTRPAGWSGRRFVAKAVAHHWLTDRQPHTVDHPEAHLPHGTPWWKLIGYDSYLLSNAEGSGVTSHIRDRARYRSLLRSSIRNMLTVRREWARLREEYRRELATITSIDRWSSSLGLDDSEPRR